MKKKRDKNYNKNIVGIKRGITRHRDYFKIFCGVTGDGGEVKYYQLFRNCNIEP